MARLETWLDRWRAKVREDPELREAYGVDESEAMGREIDRRLAQVITLNDRRPFDVGTPQRCYRCSTSASVTRVGGEGGYVYACPDCPHPAD